MLRIGRMMDLMMRGTYENVPEPTAERNPYMRVLEMHIGVNEQHQDEVGIVQGVLIGGLTEHVIAESVGDGRREGENIGEDPGVDRMHPEIRERSEHFRVVMHFVEFP